MAVVALKDLIAELCERHAAYLLALRTPDEKVWSSRNRTRVTDHCLWKLGATVRHLSRTRLVPGAAEELEAVRAEVRRYVGAPDPDLLWARSLIRRLDAVLPHVAVVPVGRSYPERTSRSGPPDRVRKLDDAKEREIRRLAAAGRRAVSLAREFGVCEATIRSVVERTSWRSVPD
jgi:hypothetical protein